MTMLEPIDSYCERTGAALLAEPLNAASNLAFLVAAIWVWRRFDGETPAPARGLALLLAGIGLASGLFHTWAVGLTAMLDVASILAFVLWYLYLANRSYCGMARGKAALATAAFLPFAAVTAPAFARLDWLGGSAAYMPVLVLIAGYAVALRRRAPATAAGLAVGAAILSVSLTFRTVDEALCEVWPHGTHWLWHVLNAAMLAWMIDVYRRQVADRAGA